MRCTRLAENTGHKNSPSAHYHTTLSDYIFTTKACIGNPKKLFKQQYLLHMPYNIVNFSPLTSEISWRIWCTPANFNGFLVLASLVHRRRSTEVNHTLHGVWPSPGLLHYIYIFDGNCKTWTQSEFCT